MVILHPFYDLSNEVIVNRKKVIVNRKKVIVRDVNPHGYSLSGLLKGFKSYSRRTASVSSYFSTPPRGQEKAPAFAAVCGRIRRPSAGYALPYGHAYRRGGYRLTPSGLRALLTVYVCRNPAPSRDAAADLPSLYLGKLNPLD